jgi:hypothetical protein
MSGTAASSYTAPIDFRVSQSPPVITNIADTNVAIADIYAFMNQTIRTFIDYCGIGPQLTASAVSLAGSSKPLLSGNLNRFYVRAAETVNFGSIISLTPVAGAVECRNANAADATRIADGFCSEVAGIAAGQVGEVILGSGVASIGGLVVGQRYWLSITNGLISNVPATAVGNIEQLLGIGIDSTHFFFHCSPMWLQH